MNFQQADDDVDQARLPGEAHDFTNPNTNHFRRRVPANNAQTSSDHGSHYHTAPQHPVGGGSDMSQNLNEASLASWPTSNTYPHSLWQSEGNMFGQWASNAYTNNLMPTPLPEFGNETIHDGLSTVTGQPGIINGDQRSYNTSGTPLFASDPQSSSLPAEGGLSHNLSSGSEEDKTAIIQRYERLTGAQEQLINQLRQELRRWSSGAAIGHSAPRVLGGTVEPRKRLPPQQQEDPALVTINKSRIQKRRAQKKGPESAPLEIPNTLDTACIRCRRVQKKCTPGGVDPAAPCALCLSVSTQTLRIPCIKSRVSDAVLFRTTTVEQDTWSFRSEIRSLSELSTLKSQQFKQISLTQDFGAVLNVYVQEFIPVDRDQTVYVHVLSDGSTSRLQMPNFALAQLEDTKNAMNRFVSDTLDIYLENYLDSGNDIMWSIFQLAIRRARWQNNTLLRDSLRLWLASRVIERPWRICGEETLGMEPVNDERSPYHGIIPVTPIMDVQIDQVAIQSILVPLRQKVLKQLQEKVSRKSKRDWFDILATIFILLNNIEIATAHDHEHAVFHGYYTPCRGTRFVDYKLVEAYFHGAQILIAHFRDALQGSVPFLKDLRDPHFAEVTAVDQEELHFLVGLRDQLLAKRDTYHSLKTMHRYESLLYWTHQLFYETWDARQVHIREIDG